MNKPTNKPTIKPDKREAEAELKAALEATFPASDPVAIAQPTATEADRPEKRRPAPLDKGLVAALADEVRRSHRKV